MKLQPYQKVVGSTAAEFSATGLTIDQFFPWAVLKQNKMYSLPVNQYPTLDELNETPVKRMSGFLQTLKQEMDEGLEILAVMQLRDEITATNLAPSEEVILHGFALHGIDQKRATKLAAEVVVWVQQTVGQDTYEDGTTELDRQILVMLADWLGDMNVYNRSEAMKYGIPLESILVCIMGSNFTKLDANGQPIINPENGKILKGPNFEPPEAHIYATLFDASDLNQELAEKQAEVEQLEALAGQVLADPMEPIFAAAQATEDEAAGLDEGEFADEYEGEDDEDYQIS